MGRATSARLHKGYPPVGGVAHLFSSLKTVGRHPYRKPSRVKDYPTRNLFPLHGSCSPCGLN
jgi:hypothetical protein